MVITSLVVFALDVDVGTVLGRQAGTVHKWGLLYYICLREKFVCLEDFSNVDLRVRLLMLVTTGQWIPRDLIRELLISGIPIGEDSHFTEATCSIISIISPRRILSISLLQIKVANLRKTH